MAGDTNDRCPPPADQCVTLLQCGYGGVRWFRERSSTSTFRPMGLKLPSTSGQDPREGHAYGTFSMMVASLPVQHSEGTTCSVSAAQPQQESKHVVDVLTAFHCCIWCIPQSSNPTACCCGLGEPSSLLLPRMQGPGLALSQAVHLTQWSRWGRSQHDNQNVTGSRSWPWPCCQGHGKRVEESASSPSPRQPQKGSLALNSFSGETNPASLVKCANQAVCLTRSSATGQS